MNSQFKPAITNNTFIVIQQGLPEDTADILYQWSTAEDYDGWRHHPVNCNTCDSGEFKCTYFYVVLGLSIFWKYTNAE